MDYITKAWYNLKSTGKATSWQNLEDFRRDIEELQRGQEQPKASEELQLTLKKGEKVYGKDTVRLATVKEIARNRVNNRLLTLTFNGVSETKTMVEWCEQLNKDYATVQLRIQRGWTQQRALTTRTNKPYSDKVQTPYKRKKPVTLPPCE
jgi:hypothetical protein